jgi:phosphate-selective porin
VAIDQATLEQILQRLAAAEAEIQTMRQNAAPNSGAATLPEPPAAAAPAAPAVIDCAKPVSDAKKINADTAKYLVVLPTDCGPITFKPGLRIQPRYIYDDLNDNNDFLIQRFRLKAGGDIFDWITYYTELKIDGTSRFGVDPKAAMENAWMDFELADEETYLRFGLYDIPFSRDALTSDSKLLFMDRSLIKDSLTGIGFADNTVGLMLHGRPFDGRYEYAFGIFDNVVFERIGAAGLSETDHLMPAGRIAVNLLDPATPPGGYGDYKGSYLGKGQRLAVGANAVNLNEITRDGGATYFDATAWGVDVFYNYLRFVFQAEYDWFILDGPPDNVRGDGWYAQAGYMLTNCWEAAVRHQQLDPDDLVGDDQLRWTSIGLNYYLWDHNVKIQTDYTFKDETDRVANNVFQVQLQLDY